MKSILMKVVCGVGLAVVGGVALAGGVVDVTAQIRSAGGEIGVTASSVNSGAEANVVDGNDGTSLEFSNEVSQWIEVEFPASLLDPIYVTGIKLTWGHLNSCCRNTVISAWDDETSEWVQVASEMAEGAVWDSSIQLPADQVKRCRKFRIELLQKQAWKYVVKEIQFYGRAGEALPPLGKVIVQTENASVAESLSHAPGEYLYIPAYPQQLDIFSATKMVEEGEALALCQGFVFEKSVDAGATWLDAVTNLDVFAYSYAAVADEWIRLTWLYSTQAIVKGDFYVDGTSGIDAAGNCHVETLSALPEVLQNGKVVHLGAGTFGVSEEVLLNGFANVTFEGAGMEGTIVEVTEGASSRHMRLQTCTNVEFKNMTFRKGSVSGTDSVYGGSFFVADSTAVKFTNCAFSDNVLTTTKNVASGGAIASVSSSLIVDGCVFERNSVVAPRALGGAMSSLTVANAPAGVVACSNTVFRKNSVEGSQNARGLAVSFGGNAGGEFVNCLAVLNRSCSGSSGAIGTGIFASNAYNDGSRYNGTDYANGQSNPVTIRNSTVAYNQANAVVTAGYGEALIENCVIRGQRSVLDRFNWYNVTMRDTFYDYCFPAGVTFTNCSQEDPLMGVDFHLAAGSPAEGCGYTFVVESTVAPKTLYVNPAAAAGGNGSKQSPFQSLTAALQGVSVGDTIELAAGSYTAATETFPIVIEDTEFVTIRGAGAGATIFSNGLAEEGTLAIRALDNVGLVMRDFSVENHRNVEVTKEPSAICIDGGVRNQLLNVTVSGCERLPADQVNVTAGQVMIRNVQGMIVSGLRIEDCTVITKGWNSTLGTSTLSMLGSIGLLENSAFVGNGCASREIDSLVFKTSGGGGTCGQDSDTVAYVEHRNLLVAQNGLLPGTGYTTSVFRSGDLFYVSGNSTFDNCTFIGTQNASMFSWDTQYTFRNCIFQNVRGFNSVTPANTPKIFHFKNCVVVTDAVCTQAEFEASVAPDSENVVYTTDAKFRNPDAGKFWFVGDSPAADAGEILPWMTAPVAAEALNVDWRAFTEPVDLNGNPRVSNKLVDVGAYEYQNVAGTRIFFR